MKTIILFTAAVSMCFFNICFAQNYSFGYNNTYNGHFNSPYYSNLYPSYGHYGKPYYGHGKPYSHKPNYGGHHAPGNQHHYSVSEADFSNFMNTLNNEYFDDSKLKMANFYAGSAPLSVQQIGRVLAQLNFDSSRIEFAKKAYSTCRDKYNYVTLRDKFSFSSSFEEVLTHIGY